MPRPKKVLPVPVGKTIKKARTDKKFSFDHVANETGFSVAYLKEVESGKTIPPVGALLQISRALEIDSGSLLKEPESKMQFFPVFPALKIYAHWVLQHHNQ